MVTLMQDIYPVYYKEFIYLGGRGRKLMCAEANKAIYSTLETSQLFWEKISKSLDKMG